MKLWGDGRRLCISGWVLAAVLLVGVNGYRLLALQTKQLAGHSPTIKTLHAQLIAWENPFPSPPRSAAAAGLETLLARHRPPARDSADAAAPDPKIVPVAPAPTRVHLPELTGMVTTLNRHGRETYRAVLDGRVYRTADRVGPFMIDAIGADGVVLSRDGRQWRLDCPRPDHSTLATH